MSTRPFKVLGIQQIAIGGLDKTRLQKLWVDNAGFGDHRAPSKANVKTWTKTFAPWAVGPSRSKWT